MAVYSSTDAPNGAISALEDSPNAASASISLSADTTNAHSSITPTALGRLGLLPAEIRNMIYELHLLPNDRKPFVARWVVSPPNHMLRPYKTRIPSILAVSRIIRRETMPIYYRSHELRFMVDCDELLCVLDRLNLLVMNLDSAGLILI
jgi:hypothetical protein